MAPLYYRNTRGALLVFDITNRDSFKDITYWINDLKENGDDNIVKLLVGNKSDIESKRTVSKEEAL